MAMTPEEHILILEMLKQQMTAFAALVEVLKNQGLVQDGDLESYTNLLDRSGKLTLIQDHLKAVYQELATTLGVETGFDPEDE